MLVCGAALSACGGDDDPAPVATATEGRYCDLANQFEQLATNAGASSLPGRYDGPPAAVSQAIGQMGETMDELVSGAPKDIDDDVEDLVAALRKAAEGDTAVLGSQPMTEAAARVTAYNQANCVVASEPGGDL